MQSFADGGFDLDQKPIRFSAPEDRRPIAGLKITYGVLARYNNSLLYLVLHRLPAAGSTRPDSFSLGSDMELSRFYAPPRTDRESVIWYRLWVNQ